MTGDPMDRLDKYEVAEILKCHPRKAAALMGDKIPAVLDYRWTAYRRDVMAYLDARTVTDRNSKQRRRGRGRRAA